MDVIRNTSKETKLDFKSLDIGDTFLFRRDGDLCIKVGDSRYLYYNKYGAWSYFDSKEHKVCFSHSPVIKLKSILSVEYPQ